MAADLARETPPKTQLTFRVGVVGHRPNRLPEDTEPLRRVVRQILEAVQHAVRRFHASHRDLFSDCRAALRAVSPLAEGSDRILAEQALDLDFELQCPMPFSQQEYEKDFQPPRALSPDSLAEFRSLLRRAELPAGLVRFECDGERTDPGAAYGATGRVVLNQSDVLVAIWDGKPAQGRGSTVEKVQEAVDLRVPVIWIDALEPDRWSVIRDKSMLPAPTDTQRARPPLPAESDHGETAAIEDLVGEILAPPPPEEAVGKDDTGSRRDAVWAKLREWVCESGLLPRARAGARGSSARVADLRETYFAETVPEWTLALLWKLFRDLVGEGRVEKPSFELPDLRESVREKWPEDAPGVAGWANQALGKHYASSNQLAVFYADCYRSAFVFAFLFSVVAVALALAPLTGLWQVAHHGSHEATAQHLPDLLTVLCAIGEPVVILLILVAIGWSWCGRWHERWISYRLVAELVRQLRFMLPLGGGRPFPKVPPFLAGYGDPERTWMYWHVRAIEREVGLPEARVDPAFLRSTVEYVRQVVQRQIAFHHKNHERSERIERRLHAAGFSLFFATFVICLVHFLPHGAVVGVPSLSLPAWLPDRLLAVLCAVLPAMGAALAGINNQGEFGRIAKRSRAMTERLVKLDERAEQLLAREGHSQARPLRSPEVIALTSDLARLMVDEVLDWRVVFQDRPPVLPA
ncbi:MAG: hypothetical protein JSV80_07510 [Acidobacteriota bacterium]|nr:MAG: hypothetical protein JSV80_07510 [Acidobacteriota bacterium]